MQLGNDAGKCTQQESGQVSPGDTTEAHRAACEARYWLRQGFTTKEKVAELRERISRKRGAAAAEKLIQNMRKEYANNRGR